MRRPFRYLPLIVGLMTFSFISCATGPKLSPMQVRELTTKLFENADYETVFRATITVLQDQGYVIKNTDMASGLILGYADRKTSTLSQVTQAAFLGYVSDKGTDVEASCMVNKISDTSTEIRINVQEAKYGQSNVFSGTSKQNTKILRDPKIYKNLFDQIQVEILRRQAMKK
jgi:hypothetical protein